MTRRRKKVLAVVLLVITALHIALFAAGGAWRTLGKVLIIVDIASAWFVVGAIQEFRKLEEKTASNSKP
jgi:hypothetical protein